MATTVDNLNVPPPEHAARKLGKMFKATDADRGLTYKAFVLDGNPSSLGKIRVLIDSTSTSARVSATTKAIQTGDTVIVRKQGGLWEVAGAETYRQPPTVQTPNAPPSATPPTSSTVSGSPLNVRSVPNAPSTGVGSTLPYVILWAGDTRAHLIRVERFQDDVRASINRVNSRLSALESAVSNNAGSANQSRYVISSIKSTQTSQNQAIASHASALKGDNIAR